MHSSILFSDPFSIVHKPAVRMSHPKDLKFTLKAIINKQKTKVLYVEADGDFADVLLSFLTLPLGTIVRVLNKHYGDEAPVVGSLTTLYSGLRNLDNGLFSSEDCKNLLLYPIRSSEVECRRLKINVDDTPPTRYFRCGGMICRFRESPNVSMYFRGLKCDCGQPLDEKIYVRGVDDGGGGVFIASKASLIISDDLQVLPNVMSSAMQILRNLGIMDTVGIEERSVTFGFNEIMDLLKGSLVSRAPFTELILDKNPMNHVAMKCEIGFLPVDLIKQLAETCSANKMTVNAIVSANKLLFAEVDASFVDFLFSLLVVPLGRVECLLRCDTCLNNIDNLHKSVENKSAEKTNAKPKPSYSIQSIGCLSPLQSVNSSGGCLVNCYKFPENEVAYSSSQYLPWQEKYVKRNTMYMVTDDLTVTPLSSFSGFSILNSLKIPLSEVKELELVVGSEHTESISDFVSRLNRWSHQSIFKETIEARGIRIHTRSELGSCNNTTMSAPKDVQFTLKVMINKDKTKVLFAEADSYFTDVLLSFLTLPLGKIAKVVVEHYGDNTLVVGSLTSLYNVTGKQMLLNPRSVFDKECRKLKLNLCDSEPTKYFTCGQSSSGNHNFSMYYDSVRCDCGKTMSTETKLRSSETVEDGDDRAFCTKDASFIISDEMRVAPYVVGSVLRILVELGITDTKGAEMRSVTFGYNEASLDSIIIDLLKGILVSRTPLTDIILGRTQNNSEVQKKIEPGVFIPKTEEAAASNSEKMMILKVVMQRSTRVFLFAQAKGDFADFLFSLLTIPLGGALSLLGSSTGVTSLDNLYTSLENINGDNHLKTKDTMTKLLNTQLPVGYMSPSQLFPLTEVGFPELHFVGNTGFPGNIDYLSPSTVTYTYKAFRSWTDRAYVAQRTSNLLRLKFPKGNENYVRVPTTYMVTDDLTVTPLCVTSSLSILDRLGIPLSDVEELELNIGLEEALSILKASLASNSALTNGLFGPSLRKERTKKVSSCFQLGIGRTCCSSCLQVRKIYTAKHNSLMFTLKAIINKQKTKVLYVEADSDFADVLLSFLTLPLGTIVRVLKKHYGDDAPVVGSLTTLYNGLRNLDNGFFSSEDCKNLLLNPIRSSEVECRRLKINIDDTPPTRYFECGDKKCQFPTLSMCFSGLKCDNGFAERVISFPGTIHGTYTR
ncbi:hypothetical protein STAS_19942 [Striga asiatica]|uniref:DUF674 family protein n=1 Tax=Striga asiatica TaxID=4170 RepID=A0A5A7QGW2_STRAF|nr:hypothetical protein STAS_19942 [Striga asiatica]